jgi:hypothetical protein
MTVTHEYVDKLERRVALPIGALERWAVKHGRELSELQDMALERRILETLETQPKERRRRKLKP